jgi:hypothetical protein
MTQQLKTVKYPDIGIQIGRFFYHNQLIVNVMRNYLKLRNRF